MWNIKCAFTVNIYGIAIVLVVSDNNYYHYYYIWESGWIEPWDVKHVIFLFEYLIFNVIPHLFLFCPSGYRMMEKNVEIVFLSNRLGRTWIYVLTFIMFIRFIALSVFIQCINDIEFIIMQLNSILYIQLNIGRLISKATLEEFAK